ncbi:MAG: hypothetical protein K0R12_1431 [Gammaproteobacteria bacterium]|nr:hypothetical protein [Gammaproteobacteria bacterium]
MLFKELYRMARLTQDLLGTILGTILWPLVAPALLLSDKIVGGSSLTNYNNYLKKNWIALKDFVQKNKLFTLTIILLGVLIIALAASPLGFGTTSNSAVLTFVSCTGIALVISIATTQHFTYQLNETALKISQQHSREIQGYENRMKSAMAANQKAILVALNSKIDQNNKRSTFDSHPSPPHLERLETSEMTDEVRVNSEKQEYVPRSSQRLSFGE